MGVLKVFLKCDKIAKYVWNSVYFYEKRYFKWKREHSSLIFLRRKLLWN